MVRSWRVTSRPFFSGWALLSLASTAHAGSFDAAGHYKADPAAVAVDDFEEYPPQAGSGGASGQGGSGEGGSPGAGQAGQSGAGQGGTGEGGTGEGGAGEGAGQAGEAPAGAAGEGGAGQGGAGGEAAGAGGEQGGAGQGGGPPPGVSYELVDDPTALTGKRVFKVGQWQSAGVGFEVPEGQGSYLARVWVKGETVAVIDVHYEDGSAPISAQLFPTGRATSDGWVELASSPFSVDTARGADAGVGFFSPTGVVADAFEVVPSGEFRSPKACGGINDSAACEADEICLHRKCVDARGFVPPMPEAKADREALADFLGNRIQFLLGPQRNRADHLGEAMAAVDEMRSATERYRFWFSWVTAIQRLEDSHSTVFGLAQSQLRDFPGRVRLNACFIGGDADLSHGDVPRDPELPDVLVSHVGGETWGLMPGDRLVAVDGQHPVTWARSLKGRSWSAEQVNDPTSHAQHIESIHRAISSMAKTITVIRCNGTSTCQKPETLEVAAQGSAGGPQPGGPQGVSCDNRPIKHLPDLPDSHDIGGDVYFGPVLESLPDERIHGVVWDSLYGAGSSTAALLNAAASSWRSEKARGVILDHRTGNGGTKDAASPLLAFVSPEKYSEVQLWRVFLDETGPKNLAEGLALFDKLKLDFFSQALVGSSEPATDVPVALLLTRDVSASDFFPNAFKGSPKARIFAPHPTNGAFSTFLGFSYWMGLTFQLASQDTVNNDGRLLCGHGVPPDEVVEPRQSDLTKGVDTVYEAALAWVRANLKPEAP